MNASPPPEEEVPEPEQEEEEPPEYEWPPDDRDPPPFPPPDDPPPFPPFPEDIPPPLRAELDALEQLDESALREVAQSRLPPNQQREYSRLLASNAAGTITDRERQELNALGEEARQLTLKKAHAFLLLKWRGYPIPSSRELEGAE